MKNTNNRKEVNWKSIDSAIEDVRDMIMQRIGEKGDGTFASRHEIFGIVSEEYHELVDALTENNNSYYSAELIDVAVACIFGLACVKARTLDW